MSILTAVGNVAVNGFWKVGAISLAMALVASSSYLGYQWHETVGQRDAVRAERDAALKQNGALTLALNTQNKAVNDMATLTEARRQQYEKAQVDLTPLTRKIDALTAAQRAMKPSVTCSESLARQRAAVEGLK